MKTNKRRIVAMVMKIQTRSKLEIFLILSWPIIFGLCLALSIYSSISISYDVAKAESIQQYHEYIVASNMIEWVAFTIGIVFFILLFRSLRKLANPNELHF